VALAAGLFAVTIHVLTPFRADALVSGALLALIVRSPDRLRLVHQLRASARLACAALVGVIVYSGGLAWTSVWVQTVGYTALAITFASLLESALTAAPRSALARTLGSPVLRSFGRYSYSIYLFHAPLLLVADTLGFARTSLPMVAGSQTPALVCYTVIFSAVMWVVGFATWWACERHFLGLKRHFRYRQRGLAGETNPTQARAA
jgi:peptidoglycan/LPS O-acetylase OafA/YrhL